VVRAYGREVRWRIHQGTVDGYVSAARAIAASDIDVVCVQHEFGLYGLWRDESWESSRWIEGAYEDHLAPFLEEVRKPTLVTLHTVLPEPTPTVRAAVRRIAAAADRLVVMAESAMAILADAYGVTTPTSVIQHGMPQIEPHGRHRLKDKLGLQDRPIVMTFGLVGPAKGLEYVIEAMPKIVARHPDVLYLIAGQTHPDLLRHRGEEYRNKLSEMVDGLGLNDNVAFVNEYLDLKDVVELLLATDVYVTPYLDPNQITSGTLSYALGAGKAVVSTPYLHAKEALADGRGILVDFRSPEQLALAIAGLFEDPDQKARLEHEAYVYGSRFTWPNTAERFVQVFQDLVDAVPSAPPTAPLPGRTPVALIATRLAENPLITPADVAPSQPGMEVVSVINPGIARVGDEVVALLRVAERPRPDGDLPDGAVMVKLEGPDPRPMPFPPGADLTDYVGMPFLRMEAGRPRIVLGYVPRKLLGLDLSDPRAIRYRDPAEEYRGPGSGITEYLTNISHLRVARSFDGIHFEVDDEPAIRPETDLEEYGVEDPRMVEIDGEFHITYVSASRLGITTSRLRTTDFRTFERQGVMLLPDQKDVVLFPERVDGVFLALTRPMPNSFGRVLGIWLAESPDLVHWGRHRPVALPRPGLWDDARLGASLSPIRLDEGWLELYHGADHANRYGMGALLLDGDDPSTVLARTPDPLLVPETDYERAGFLHDVVFPSGHVALDKDSARIRVYYGAADSVVAAADFSLEDVVASLRQC